MSEQIAEQPPIEQAPPPEAPPQEAPPPVEAAPPPDDDALEPEIAAQVIDIPDGEKLVPLSALTKTRAQLKEAKAGSKEAEGLKQQIASLEAQVQQSQPMIQAAQAILAAQQQPQVQPPQAPAENVAELEEIAKDFDFYQADGKLDLDRSRRYLAREQKRATAIAQQEVQPLIQNTLQERASHNMARARATVMPDGRKADPVILDGLLNHIASQPNGLQTLADDRQVKMLLMLAVGATPQQAAAAVEPKPAPPPPIFSEKAGGQAIAQKSLSESDKRLAKDLGMTDAQFLKEASSMPW